MLRQERQESVLEAREPYSRVRFEHAFANQILFEPSSSVREVLPCTLLTPVIILNRGCTA